MKFINGWTKESTIQRIKERNTGTKCTTSTGVRCVYHDPKTNNHCAVGCFIPEGHKGMQFEGGSYGLLNEYPELVQHMPLSPQYMSDMQEVHDKATDEQVTNIHQILEDWINANA